MNQYEREEKQLERDLADGLISDAEYRKQQREMEQSYADELRGMAEDAAERAYNDTMERW